MVLPKPNPLKNKILTLMSEKDKIETKISECGEILSTNGDVGMNSPLVDAEGFPRNDIDIYRVRQARQQICCLQNDHKQLMKQIEHCIHKLHAESRDDEHDIPLKTTAMEQNGTNHSNDGPSDLHRLTPIVKVNLVSPDSPAEHAGLRNGDDIIEFGSVNSRNFGNNLEEIGVIVRHMQNQNVPIRVQRGMESLDLILIPKVWSGRGLLGCNIILLEH